MKKILCMLLCILLAALPALTAAEMPKLPTLPTALEPSATAGPAEIPEPTEAAVPVETAPAAEPAVTEAFLSDRIDIRQTLEVQDLTGWPALLLQLMGQPEQAEILQALPEVLKNTALHAQYDMSGALLTLEYAGSEITSVGLGTCEKGLLLVSSLFGELALLDTWEQLGVPAFEANDDEQAQLPVHTQEYLSEEIEWFTSKSSPVSDRTVSSSQGIQSPAFHEIEVMTLNNDAVIGLIDAIEQDLSEARLLKQEIAEALPDTGIAMDAPFETETAPQDKAEVPEDLTAFFEELRQALRTQRVTITCYNMYAVTVAFDLSITYTRDASESSLEAFVTVGETGEDLGFDIALRSKTSTFSANGALTATENGLNGYALLSAKNTEAQQKLTLRLEGDVKDEETENGSLLNMSCSLLLPGGSSASPLLVFKSTAEIDEDESGRLSANAVSTVSLTPDGAPLATLKTQMHTESADQPLIAYDTVLDLSNATEKDRLALRETVKSNGMDVILNLVRVLPAPLARTLLIHLITSF